MGSSGLYFEARVPEKVHRHEAMAKARKRRVCMDDRAYFPVQFTIPSSILAVQEYQPGWTVDRDYWVAKATAECGLHDGSHPSDGAAAGSDLKATVRRITKDLTGNASVFANDSVLTIETGDHSDTISVNEDGLWQQGMLNLPEISQGEHLYIDVTQVGTAGTLVVTVVLVPKRFYEGE